MNFLPNSSFIAPMEIWAIKITAKIPIVIND